MGECEHIEITDEGVCKACGVDITSQEFIDSLPEVPAEVQLGDISAIIRLAQDTAEEFLFRLTETRDPHSPDKPKIRWIGTQLVRPPRETIWTEVCRPAFSKAKALGYRSNYQRWEEICLEYVALSIQKNSSKK